LCAGKRTQDRKKDEAPLIWTPKKGKGLIVRVVQDGREPEKRGVPHVEGGT